MKIGLYLGTYFLDIKRESNTLLMGYKNVCLNCKTAFSTGMDYKEIKSSKCTKCVEAMISVSHKFKPPKKSDISGWKLVSFLIENGFRFDSANDESYKRVQYPKTLEEAKEFVRLYKAPPQE